MSTILVIALVYFVLFFKVLKVKDKERIYVWGIIISLILPFNINILIQNNTISTYISSLFIMTICMIILCLNKKTFKITRLDVILIAFLIVITISTINNDITDHISFITSMITYLSIIFIWLIVKSLKYDKFQFIKRLSFVAIMNGIISIFQYILNKKLLIGVFNQPIIYTEGLSEVKRAVGIAGTNNSAGNLAALLYMLSLYNYLKYKRKRDLFACILSCIAGALSLTRIGLLGILVGSGLMFLFINAKNLKQILNKFKIMVGVAVLGGGFLALFYQQIIDVLFNQRGNTASYRFLQLNYVNNLILDNTTNFIEGIGIGQYKSYLLNNYYIQEIDLHFQYINTLVELGATGLLVFLIFNIYIVVKGLKVNKDNITKSFIISFAIVNLIIANFNPNQNYLINNIIYYLVMFNLLKSISINIPS